METPWGHADHVTELAEGIVSVGTPSHGGVRLSAERQAQLPAGIDNFLHNLEWWEEDCDWAVPYVVFQDEIRAAGKAYKFDENLAAARSTARHFHPELALGPGDTPANRAYWRRQLEIGNALQG